MKSLKTKYLGPTKFRGSRVRASASWCPTTLTIAWNDALSSDDNHRKAAKALADKLGWLGIRMEGGVAK